MISYFNRLFYLITGLLLALSMPQLLRAEEVKIAGRVATKVVATGPNGGIASVREPNALPGRYRVVYEVGVMPDAPSDNRHFNVVIEAAGVGRYAMTDYYKVNFPADGSPLTITREFELSKPTPFYSSLNWWVGIDSMTMLVYSSKLERIDKGAALLGFQARKLLYTPGEKAFVDAIVANGTDRHENLTLAVTVMKEFKVLQTLKPVTISLEVGETKTVEVPLPTMRDEYGYSIIGTLSAGETVMDTRSDVFNVADNVWKVALGSATLTINNGGSYKGSHETNLQDLAKSRNKYINWWECDFWAPDDWGDLNPKEDHWAGGQTGYLESGPTLKEFIRLAKANGIRSITYGKHNACAQSGWELARKHPDWFYMDQLGQPYGVYDAWALQNWNAPERFTSTAFQQKFKPYPWYYLYANFTRIDVLDYGIDQMALSAKNFGWDGVRFDGHWSAGNDDMSTRNIQRMKERIWAVHPNFLFGYNDNTPHTASTEYLTSKEYLERSAGYGHMMNEQIRNYSSTADGLRYSTWSAYAEGMLADVAIIRKNGATYHCILDNRDNYYKYVLCTVAGGHTVYGDHLTAPGSPNWGRFLTQWSGPVWDVMLKGVPAEDRVEVKANSPIWWDKWITERPVDNKTYQRIVHLIVPPGVDKIPDSKRSDPVTNVVVRTKIAKIGTLSGAYLLDTDTSDEPTKLAVTMDGEWAQVTVPKVTGWSMIVWEFSGNYIRTAAPANITGRPDPAKITEAEKMTAKPAPKDPLHPNEDPTGAGATILKEAESLPAADDNALIIEDKDASNGNARRLDGLCAGRSSPFGHNAYVSIPAGHYRASYRIKIEDKNKDTKMHLYASWKVKDVDAITQIVNIVPADFKESNVYQDFNFDFDFPGDVTLYLSGGWNGSGKPGALIVDYTTLKLLEIYSDVKVEEARKNKDKPLRTDLVPGVVTDPELFNDMDAPADATPAEKKTILPQHPKRDAFTAAPVRVLIVNGMHSEVYDVTSGLPHDWNITNLFAGRDPDQYIKQYPERLEQLYAYHAVVLVNVDAGALGYEKRRQLKQFIASGGGLFILGGMHSLGQGQFKNTFLEDMMPVEVAPARDIKQADKPLQLLPAKEGLAKSLPADTWKEAPAFLYWRHVVNPKQDSVVHLYAGTEPVLLTNRYQLGRVAVFTGTVLGEPVGKEQPFWKWSGWPLLANATMKWAVEGEAVTTKKLVLEAPVSLAPGVNTFVINVNGKVTTEDATWTITPDVTPHPTGNGRVITFPAAATPVKYSISVTCNGETAHPIVVCVSIPYVTATKVDIGTAETKGAEYRQGMWFTVGTEPITVTHLGRIAQGTGIENGEIKPIATMTGTHNMRLYSKNGDAVRAVVDLTMTTGILVGDFKYAALLKPVTLAANTDYYIDSQEHTDGDAYYQVPTTVTTTAVAVVKGDQYSGNCSANTNKTRGPVSFLYF